MPFLPWNVCGMFVQSLDGKFLDGPWMSSAFGFHRLWSARMLCILHASPRQGMLQKEVALKAEAAGAVWNEVISKSF